MNFIELREALDQPRNRYPVRGGTTIYALVDPWDRRVRYVGKTRCRLEERLDRHLQAPTNRAMGEWVSGLRGQGRQPIIMVLEYVQAGEWESAERGWIAWFKQRGELLNVDPGGAYRTTEGKPRNLVTLAFKPPQEGTETEVSRLRRERNAKAGAKNKWAAQAERNRMEREQIRLKSGPVRRLSREEIAKIYGK